MNINQKVLIVDDEPRNQRIIAETFDGLVDFQVVSSGEAALELIESYRPDLVLLDIMMPGIDGYEVCRRIRTNPQATLTKVILVSGKAMLEERLKGYEAGADDYMTKPFVTEELLAKARVFLRLNAAEKGLLELNQDLDQQVKVRTEMLLQAEAKLINAAKMSALGEMAGGIAHEINTPLGTIGLIADQLKDMLAEASVDQVGVLEMVQIVSTTVDRISAIIRGLKTFSRDGSQDRFDSVPLQQILEGTLGLCNERLKSGNIKVESKFADENVQVRCRSVQISQVLLNLIGNACDAISDLPEKWIQISVETKADLIEISVTDSGGGISESVREKLFQPFFTTKDIGKGTGLGLSISSGIVSAHHGTLTIDPVCANTRFVLTLPSGVAHDGELSLNKLAAS